MYEQSFFLKSSRFISLKSVFFLGGGDGNQYSTYLQMYNRRISCIADLHKHDQNIMAERSSFQDVNKSL